MPSAAAPRDWPFRRNRRATWPPRRRWGRRPAASPRPSPRRRRTTRRTLRSGESRRFQPCGDDDIFVMRDRMMLTRWLPVGALAIAAAACATAPTPTEASRRIAAKPPAIIEGRVTDTAGRPVAGIAVRGIPRGADIPWAPPAVTDCDGRFRLSVPAPAAYGFLLAWKG